MEQLRTCFRNVSQGKGMLHCVRYSLEPGPQMPGHGSASCSTSSTCSLRSFSASTRSSCAKRSPGRWRPGGFQTWSRFRWPSRLRFATTAAACTSLVRNTYVSVDALVDVSFEVSFEVSFDVSCTCFVTCCVVIPTLTGECGGDAGACVQPLPPVCKGQPGSGAAVPAPGQDAHRPVAHQVR